MECFIRRKKRSEMVARVMRTAAERVTKRIACSRERDSERRAEERSRGAEEQRRREAGKSNNIPRVS